MDAGPRSLPRRRAPGAVRAAAAYLGAAALAALLPLGGCATYTSRVADLRPSLAAGDFDKALATIESTREGKDRLLYWLERGLILHYADRYAESNEAFQTAEELAADLYTRSISEGAFSLLTSDETISYRASPQEMAMVPYYRALDYVYLGRREDAVVEARKASLYLRQYVARTQEALGAEGEIDPEAARDLDLLADNAFLQYFSGLLYEWDGELNDAFISYRNAADAYAVAGAALAVATPPWLAGDLRRTGGRLGFADELAELARRHPALFAAADSADAADSPDPAAAVAADPAGPRGEVVLLFELGYVASRKQVELNVPVLERDDRTDVPALSRRLAVRTRSDWDAGDARIAYWLRVAVPELVQTPAPAATVRVSAPVAGAHAVAVPVEDVSGRVRLGFEAERGTILLKTLARGLAKYAATEGADDQGAVAGILANIFGAVTEKADTRSWLTLPQRILMVRLSLPAGRYDLKVELADAAGAPLRTEVLPDLVVRAGDWTFANRRIF